MTADDRTPASTDLRLRPALPPVMRLSRRALLTIGAISGLSVGAIVIYALQPAERATPEQVYGDEPHTPAEAIASAPKDYSDVPKLGPPLQGGLGGPSLDTRAVNDPARDSPFGIGAAAPARPDAGRDRQLRERDAARTSRLFVGRETSGAGAFRDPDATSDMAPAGRPRPPAGEPAAQPRIEAPADPAPRKLAVLAARDDRSTGGGARISVAPSPYVLQAGSVIPAALITGIRSDLPGQVTAQVTENVYDSPTGRILLIPQGARLVGTYDADIDIGQRRVLLAWTRLILPGGASIALPGLPAADAGGYAGLEDGVDQHWGDLARAALVSSLLGIGAELAADDDDLARAWRRGMQGTTNQAGQQLIRRELGIEPTLTIRPGHPLRVVVTRDLVVPAFADADRRQATEDTGSLWDCAADCRAG